MEIVNVHAAKTHLSQLLARVEAGEEVVIGRAGHPVARLVPFTGRAAPRRRFGGWRGRGWISDDFDAPLPEEILKTFLGEG
jgi:prevent-host-death family protein